jgi:hypothetical protein
MSEDPSSSSFSMDQMVNIPLNDEVDTATCTTVGNGGVPTDSEIDDDFVHISPDDCQEISSKIAVSTL